MIESRRFPQALRALLLLALLFFPTVVRGDDEALPKPEKLILGEMIGNFGKNGMKWKENWNSDNTKALTSAAKTALDVATHPELDRQRLRAEIKHGGDDVKAAPRNLDIGRHDLVKHLIARACERANQKLAADKLSPLLKATTVNSGGTGDFTRDVDVTVIAGDEVREQYLFEALLVEADALKLKYEVDPKLGVKAGINFPQIEVAMHRGVNDLPDARFASDVHTFAANYRRVIESQAKNPEAYFGYGFEVEVQGRRSLSFKPGQTLVQEFTCEPGKPVEYKGQIASCQREVRAILRGAIGQRYRRAQNASHITNHYLQAFRHEQGSDHDLTKGALKYAGRSIEALCEYHGMKNWPDLQLADRMVILKSIFPPGFDSTANGRETMANMARSLDVAYLTFVGKKVPEHLLEKSKEKGANYDVDMCMRFMQKAVSATASSVAAEMLEPPSFDPKFLAEKAGPNWDMMNAEERAKFAMTTDDNYKKCCSVAAMENLLCIVQQVRQLDLPEYNKKGTTPGKEALQDMLASADERTRPILELAIDHAEAAVLLDTTKDPVRRKLAAEKLKGYREKMQKLTGVQSAGETVIDNASKITVDNYIASNKAKKPSPLGQDIAELRTRFMEHIEEAFPPTDLAAFRAHLREVGVKSYMVNKLIHEAASPATVLDVINLIEIYQNGGGKAELAKAAGMSLVNRGHWALGFLIQAAEVKNENDLCELGKNVIFDAFCRLVPAAGTFKIAFDIEKGLVNITVGYTINRLNTDLIDALYTGAAGRLNENLDGKVAGQLRSSGFCVLEDGYVHKETDEKTKKESIVIDRPTMYVDYFKRFTGRDYNDRATPIAEKRAANLAKYHDALIRLMANQAACQEPAWFGEQTTLKPTTEEMLQAMADYSKALEIFTRPAAQTVLNESAVREYIKDGKNVIEEGLVARFTQDMLLGTMATWQTKQIERNEAKREVESTANFADMSQMAKSIFEKLKPKKTEKPEYRLEVGVTGADLNEELDGSAPIPFRFILHGVGQAPSDAPTVAFEVDQGELSPPKNGKAYQSFERVKQEFTVRAVTDKGETLAEEKFRVTVVLPEKNTALTLLEYVSKNDDGKVSEQYTYFDTNALKKAKINVKYESVGGKVYHGKYVEYDYKGRLKTETTYKYGLKDGVVRGYDTGGDGSGGEKHWLAAETIYKMDKQVCHTCYYPDGEKNWEMEYNDKGDIVANTTYWGEGGKIMGKSVYAEQSGKPGYREGTFVAYWKNGNVRIKSGYRNADIGTLVSGENIESLAHGPWERNFKNGMASERGTMADGVPVGKWEDYNDKGTLNSKVTFDQSGKEIEAERWTYYEDGKLQAHSHTIGGLKTGEWTTYYGNGQLSLKETYTDNVLNGPYAKGNEKGVLTDEGAYLQDLKNGTWISRFDDGKLISESSWSKGKQNGQYTSYNANGSVAMKCGYKDDVMDGKYEKRRENGKMEESGGYLNGEKDGHWVYFDEKGNRKYWEEYKKGRCVKSGDYKEEKK